MYDSDTPKIQRLLEDDTNLPFFNLNTLTTWNISIKITNAANINKNTFTCNNKLTIYL